MTFAYLVTSILVSSVLLSQWIHWRQLRRLAQGYYSVKSNLSDVRTNCDGLAASLNDQSSTMQAFTQLLSKQTVALESLNASVTELSTKYTEVCDFVVDTTLPSVASRTTASLLAEQPPSITAGQALWMGLEERIGNADSVHLPESKPALLNIGCGNTYDPRWINVDLNPSSPDVHAVDALKPLPLPDSCIDVVYTSHVLEHIPPHAVPLFFHELRRILKPSGLLRIVVPDLEQIASEYLRALQAAKDGDPHGRLLHRWMIVELLDQLVRQSADGGEMMRFLFRHGSEGIDIATRRLGSEIAETRVAWDPGKTKGEWALEVAEEKLFSDDNLFERRSNITLYELARFRTSGEVHLWMYDKVSLTDLLLERGFVDPVVHTAYSSGIPDFQLYHLDVTKEGIQRKPDSLYMEATLSKPHDS
jgi:predicted SAM-dependent methyltransferase